MKNTLKFILLCLTGFVFAQNTNARDSTKQEKYIALRNAILIEKLALTAKEQADFLPLYNEYKEKEKELIKRERKLIRSSQSTALSSAQAKEILNKLQKVRQQQANNYKQYMDKFLTVLPAEKVLKLYSVEKEIRKILVQKIKKRKKP